jgi:CRISPR system Cascade subunit CasA
MNLIKDIWLPVIRNDGMREKIAIWQILDSYKENPVIDIEAPRPDFRNALYQLLIGIVQVAAMPDDEEDWGELWTKPYSADEFKKKILAYEDCFEIDSDGPAFMQDYSLEEYKKDDLTNIFINLPSNKHFNKITPNEIDGYWAAIALYTLQTFASGGGRGQMTGIRGGGPLTTILMFEYINLQIATIWQKIWLNVLSNGHLSNLYGNLMKKEKGDIFPWMKPTKISRSGIGLYNQECHPFHIYFGMPRRIRLHFTDKESVCMLSGEVVEKVVTSYNSTPYGNNYSGVWIHPLNAYRVDPNKKEEPPISEKGQPGGIAYHYWPKVALGYLFDTKIPPLVLSVSQSSEERKKILKSNQIYVWAAGYDNDKMKARCWYEAIMPVYSLEMQQAKEVELITNNFISFSIDCSRTIPFFIKQAWYKNPKEVKGSLSYIANTLFHYTENDFYQILSHLVNDIFNNKNISQCSADWKKIIINQSLELFDTWALSCQEEGLDMKRVIAARNGLKRAIFGSAKKYINDMIVNE